MPHLKSKTVFYFNELSDAAKERARDWFRGLESEYFDTEFVIEDAERMAEILGITFDQKAIKLMGGGTTTRPTVYWSGFSSQGDGASFEGRYAYAKGAHAAIRKEAPTDKVLHRIADDLLAIQRKANYKLQARATQGTGSNFYSHSGTMAVEVWHGDNEYSVNVDEDGIKSALRSFADWIYRQLEAEYYWRMEAEQVDDSILANEYEFTEDGRRTC